jgi:anti-sigma factor RsiW
MSACPKNTEWVLYAAGEVSDRRARALAAHMAECEACRSEAAAVARGLKALAHLERQTPVRPEAMETLRRRLRVAADHKQSRPTILTVLRQYRWLAAAAVIVAVALVWGLAPGPQPPAPAVLPMTDAQVQEALAEITAGVEMLETGMNGQAHDVAAPRADTPTDDPADEIERFLESLRDDIDA